MKFKNSVLDKVLSFITGLAAVLTVALMLLLLINSHIKSGNGFLPADVLEILAQVLAYALQGVLAMTGLIFSLRRGLIITIIYLLILVAAIILTYFPQIIPFI